jgi:hypothetical protein
MRRSTFAAAPPRFKVAVAAVTSFSEYGMKPPMEIRTQPAHPPYRHNVRYHPHRVSVQFPKSGPEGSLTAEILSLGQRPIRLIQVASRNSRTLESMRVTSVPYMWMDIAVVAAVLWTRWISL